MNARKNHGELFTNEVLDVTDLAVAQRNRSALPRGPWEPFLKNTDR
jgi:hypothetical protein